MAGAGAGSRPARCPAPARRAHRSAGAGSTARGRSPPPRVARPTRRMRLSIFDPPPMDHRRVREAARRCSELAGEDSFAGSTSVVIATMAARDSRTPVRATGRPTFAAIDGPADCGPCMAIDARRRTLCSRDGRTSTCQPDREPAQPSRRHGSAFSSPASSICSGRRSALRRSSCWRTPAASSTCRPRPAAASPPIIRATARRRATHRRAGDRGLPRLRLCRGAVGLLRRHDQAALSGALRRRSRTWLAQGRGLRRQDLRARLAS